MNAAPLPPVISSRPKRRYLWLWGLVAVPPLLLFCLVLGVANCFRQTSELRSLRQSLSAANGATWKRQVTVHAGFLTLDAVRLALAQVRMDPAARAGLMGVRTADVGVYHLADPAAAPGRAAMLSAADACLSQRGWERVVAVLNSKTLVAVYAPQSVGSPGKIKCCVVVQEGCQLVLVSAQANPEPLVQLALNQPCFQPGHPWSLASR